MRTYREFLARAPFRERVRTKVRDLAVLGLSVGRFVSATGSWIRFLCYHHVLDDERRGFDRQLAYMERFGDFIAIDDVIAAAAVGTRLMGRHFCITFDDGLESCHRNAMPILLRHRAPAAFFLATRFLDATDRVDRNAGRAFLDDRYGELEFLTWDHCRAMKDAGMTFGSHTVSHTPLIRLDASRVETELRESKMVIERELGVECRHFCAPLGFPGRDFVVGRDPEIARRIGYRSFLTTRRGSCDHSVNPYLVERDRVLAMWQLYRLRYVFSH